MEDNSGKFLELFSLEHSFDYLGLAISSGGGIGALGEHAGRVIRRGCRVDRGAIDRGAGYQVAG
jgi:hypothetical protein